MFQRVGVVGGGIMGAGIAEVCARAGLDVVLHDVDAERAARAQERIQTSLQRAVSRGKVTPEAADAAISRVRSTDQLEQVHDRQLVVEAIFEDEGAKTALLSRLDEIVEQPDAIFASNTSSIPIMKLAMATGRRDRVVGLHFFNPVPVLGLVELIPSLLTSEETNTQIKTFAEEQLGKHVIESQDRAGFIVNALLVPYILSAIRMLESRTPGTVMSAR